MLLLRRRLRIKQAPVEPTADRLRNADAVPIPLRPLEEAGENQPVPVEPTAELRLEYVVPTPLPPLQEATSESDPARRPGVRAGFRQKGIVPAIE